MEKNGLVFLFIETSQVFSVVKSFHGNFI